MKKAIITACFFLTALSLVTNLVTDAFFMQSCIEMKIAEKEGTKEVDNELDQDKEKIFPDNRILLRLWVFQNNQHLHPPTKTLPGALDTDINPPEFKQA